MQSRFFSNNRAPLSPIEQRKRNVRLIAITLLILLNLGIGLDFARAWTQRHLNTIVSELTQAANVFSLAQDNPQAAIPQIRAHLTAARTEMDTIRPAITVGEWLSTVPVIGAYVQEGAGWWRFAAATIQMAEQLMIVGELGGATLESHGTAGVIAQIPTLQGHLEAAQQHFAEAQAARQQIGNVPDWLPARFTSELDVALEQWDRYASQLDTTINGGVRLLDIGAVLLNNDTPQTYLVLLQSSDELRPTGGFINSVGLIRVAQANIEVLSLNESVNVNDMVRWTPHQGYLEEPTPPPPPLSEYMGLGHWVVRDSNWWADFPTSARQAVEMWRHNSDTPVDGVIALTDKGVAAMVAAIGPLRLADGRVVNSENFQQIVRSSLYNGSDSSSQDPQATFFTYLTEHIISQLGQLPEHKLVSMAEHVPTAFDQHEILIMSFDPDQAAALNELGIDGALATAQYDDYLHVNEFNMSFNKLSPFIDHSLAYQVDLGPNGYPTLSTLSIEMSNAYNPALRPPEYPEIYFSGGRWDPVTRLVDRQPGYYGGYTRLYLPPHSQVLNVSGYSDTPIVTQEGPHVVVGGYVGLYATQQTQLRYKWKPGGAPSQPGQYRLLLQRQPGAPPREVNVVVHLPQGYAPANITPPPAIRTRQTVTWRTDLQQNRTLSLVLNQVAGSTADISPTPLRAAIRTTRPVRLSMDAVGVNAIIEPVGLEPDTNLLVYPARVGVVGWYQYGSIPEEGANTVLVGHSIRNGVPGAFAQLHTLQPDDTITVQSNTDTRYTYIVDTVDVYQADGQLLNEVFGATTQPTLTLLTYEEPARSTAETPQSYVVVRARQQ